MVEQRDLTGRGVEAELVEIQALAIDQFGQARLAGNIELACRQPGGADRPFQPGTFLGLQQLQVGVDRTCQFRLRAEHQDFLDDADQADHRVTVQPGQLGGRHAALGQRATPGVDLIHRAHRIGNPRGQRRVNTRGIGIHQGGGECCALLVRLGLPRRQRRRQIGAAGTDRAGADAAFLLYGVHQVAQLRRQFRDAAQIPHVIGGAEIHREYPDRQDQHAENRQGQGKADTGADADVLQADPADAHAPSPPPAGPPTAPLAARRGRPDTGPHAAEIRLQRIALNACPSLLPGPGRGCIFLPRQPKHCGFRLSAAEWSRCCQTACPKPWIYPCPFYAVSARAPRSTTAASAAAPNSPPPMKV